MALAVSTMACSSLSKPDEIRVLKDSPKAAVAPAADRAVPAVAGPQRLPQPAIGGPAARPTPAAARPRAKGG